MVANRYEIRKHQDNQIKHQNVLTMNSKIAQNLSAEKFKRRFGVQRSTFKQVLKALKPYWQPEAKPGNRPKLQLAERILVILEYWREYRTYFHIATDWHVSESTVCRIVHWVEDHLMHSGCFRLPGQKSLVRGFGRPGVVVVDVTETPIERPKRHQRRFYSGKKKQHTLKCQVIIEQFSGKVICLFFGHGSQHDCKTFKASGVHFDPDTKSLHDKSLSRH